MSTTLSPNSPVPSSSSLPQPQHNAYTRFTRNWLIPGTVVGATCGGLTGGALSGWYHRPMWHSTLNVGAKFGAISFSYFANLTLLTERVPVESLPRPVAHGISGAVTGFIMGGLGGGSFPGAARGAMSGVIVSAPIWFLMEGRHQLLHLIKQNSTGTERPAVEATATSKQ